MFVYQDNKLFVETEGKLVGANVTPTGITLVDETCDFIDGDILTLNEVMCRFNEGYTFQSKAGDTDGESGEVDTDESASKRGRPRK